MSAMTDELSSLPRLTHPYYYGEVVGLTSDPDKKGAVQAKITGVTDMWEDKLQPWIYPQLMQGIIQVPQKGHWLLVRFKDGDINQGLYYAISPTKNFTPEQYISGYPDIAVMNMGETGYLYTHDRKKHTTTIVNPGNFANLTWNETGEITLDSSNHSDEVGRQTVPVLTEATIDIFTCRPVGNPSSGIRSGSEYLSVAHISKQSIDVLRGAGSGTVKKAETSVETIGDGTDTREITGVSATYGIPFVASPAWLQRNGKKALRILIWATGTTPLTEVLGLYTSDSAKTSAHYLVGLKDGDVDVPGNSDSLGGNQELTNAGFVQCVELENDATLGSDMTDKTIKGKPNVDAVSVMFYGNGDLNEYQTARLADIVNHVKTTFKVEEIKVVAYVPPGFAKKFAMAKIWNNLHQHEGVR